MARKLTMNLERQFVALPAEQRAAWEYAMGIISEYMRKAQLEMAEGEKKSEIDQPYKNSIAQDCRGQLTDASGTLLEGEHENGKDLGIISFGGAGGRGAEGNNPLLRNTQSDCQSANHVEQRPPHKRRRRERPGLLDRIPAGPHSADGHK